MVQARRKTVSAELTQLAFELYKHYGTKSDAIRELALKGYTTSEIANAMGIKYQHARNVLSRPLKRNSQHEESDEGSLGD